MTVRPWGFQVVIDMDELREGVQLAVDMNRSLEDARSSVQDRTMPLVLRATGKRRWRQELRVAE